MAEARLHEAAYMDVGLYGVRAEQHPHVLESAQAEPAGDNDARVADGCRAPPTDTYPFIGRPSRKRPLINAFSGRGVNVSVSVPAMVACNTSEDGGKHKRQKDLVDDLDGHVLAHGRMRHEDLVPHQIAGPRRKA